MIESKEIRKIWKKEYEHGDIDAAVQFTGVGPKTISRALRQGLFTQKTFDLINAYFLHKRELKSTQEKKLVEQYRQQS